MPVTSNCPDQVSWNVAYIIFCSAQKRAVDAWFYFGDNVFLPLPKEVSSVSARLLFGTRTHKEIREAVSVHKIPVSSNLS